MQYGMLATKAMITSESQNELVGLLRCVAAGDQDALTELYFQVEPRVYAFAHSRLGDGEHAADVLQEVMLEVWRRADTFRGRSRPLTWVLGIAHHKIIDVLRRLGRFEPTSPDEDTADDDPSPFEEAEQSEMQEVLRQALGALSDAHRQVVHLAFYEDLSYPEIARILDIPEGTVKTRMFHAKKALRRRLGPHLRGGAS